VELRAGLNAIMLSKYLSPTGNRTPAVQPVARLYTEAIPSFFSNSVIQYASVLCEISYV
jgi:hypothetical protein